MTQFTDALPQETENQKTGRLAAKAFEANTPDSWISKRLDGDDDFGYDFQIQVVNDSCVQDIFRAQLKGMKEPKPNADGTHFSVVLSMSTVNYYANAADPCLLILCDVGSSDRAKDCILYYSWIQDELARIRGIGVEPGQASVTFYVPVAQVFDENTDLSADIARFRRLAHLGNDFEGLLTESGVLATARSSAIGRLVPNLARRSPALVMALVDEDSHSSWVEAPEGSLPWIFQKADASIKSGRREDGRSLLEAARKDLSTAKPSEQADYWHLQGRLHALLSEPDAARTSFAKAFDLNPSLPKHMESWAEAELQTRWVDGVCPDLSDVIARLTIDRPSIHSIRSRLFAAQGDMGEAARIADAIVGPEGDLARAIVLSLQYRWNESIEASTRALSEIRAGKDHTKLPLLTLRARARFFLALRLNGTAEGDLQAPVTGPPNLDAGLLRQAWDDIKEVVSILRARGWPPHVDAVADLWGNTAVMLGLHKSVLPLMEEASSAQPKLQTLQAATELVAFQSADFSVALAANARQDDSARARLKRVTLLHLADRHRDCITLMTSSMDEATSDPLDRVRALSSALISAERLVRPDLVSTWKAELEAMPEAKPILALERYRQALSKSSFARDQAIQSLLVDFEMLEFPISLGRVLLHELDSARTNDAEILLKVADRLERQQRLDVSEIFAVAQAHVTLRQWHDLLQLSEKAQLQYPQHDRLVAISALALDRIGRTSEARDRLSTIVNNATPDSLAISTYINIAIVSGFTEEAIAHLEGVLASETTSSGQFRCLKHLYGLIQASDQESPRLGVIAWLMGERANQEDEHEEGVFLMAMLGTPTSDDDALVKERAEAFQKRMDAFTERFPDSKILRRFTLPDANSAASILHAIGAVVGLSEQEIRGRTRLENQLSRGELPIPYAWRPRFVLSQVPDVPTMFEMAKRSAGHRKDIQLIMATEDWKPASQPGVHDQVPLLDLTALVVINALDLFDVLFQVFPTIGVGKATLIELQRLMSPMGMSPSHNVCRSIFNALKARFAQVEQPSADAPSEDSFLKARWTSQEVVELVRTIDRYWCYSDDAIFRLYATEGRDDRFSSCTLDLLIKADELALLSSREVAQRLALLCAWGVGVAVPFRFQVAVLPEHLAAARDLEHADIALESDTASVALLGGLWHHTKPMSALQGHAGALLRQIMETEQSSLVRAGAVITFWAKKVRLHPEAPTSAEGLFALPIGEAASSDPAWDDRKARPLWSVYRAIVEHHHGNTMDDSRYDESIFALAVTAARSDLIHGLTGSASIVARLRSGLTDGTSDADKFDSAVTRATLELAARQGRGD